MDLVDKIYDEITTNLVVDEGYLRNKDGPWSHIARKAVRSKRSGG